MLVLEELRNDHKQISDDYEKRLEETQGALEASKPILTEAKQLLDVTRERCLKAEADLRTAMAEIDEKAKIIAAKDTKIYVLDQQGIKDKANMVAANEIITAKEIELHDAVTKSNEQKADLKECLARAEETAVRHVVRAREAETQLELANTILREMKETRANERIFDGSPGKRFRTPNFLFHFFLESRARSETHLLKSHVL